MWVLGRASKLRHGGATAARPTTSARSPIVYLVARIWSFARSKYLFALFGVLAVVAVLTCLPIGHQSSLSLSNAFRSHSSSPSRFPLHVPIESSPPASPSTFPSPSPSLFPSPPPSPTSPEPPPAVVHNHFDVPALPDSRNLTAKSLQRRYVELVLASMAVPCSVPTDVSSSSTATAPSAAFSFLSCSRPPVASLVCNAPLPYTLNASVSALPLWPVVLLTSHDTHITGLYKAGEESGSSSCILHSLIILAGPIQQTIEISRATDNTAVVRLDGVRLVPAHDGVIVWPLLNKGNLTIIDSTADTRTTSVVVQLGYNATMASSNNPFAFRLRVDLSGPTAEQPTSYLCNVITLAHNRSLAPVAGVLLDEGDRAKYLLPHTAIIAQQPADDGSRQIRDTNFGLNTSRFAVEGYSLYSHPLLPACQLPIASVSYNPLSAASPVYTIPRILHETWIGPLIVPWLWINSWRRDYLQRHDGWVHLLWRGDNIQQLEFLDHQLYQGEVLHYCRSDIGRTAITRAYGGMYIDGDSLSLDARPLDELFVAANETGFFIAREKADSKMFAVGIFGTRPNNPVMRHFQFHQRNNTLHFPADMPWKRTGPGAVTQALNSCGFTYDPRVSYNATEQPVVAGQQQCEFTEIHSSKFYPVFWVQQAFSTHIDASLYPTSLMFQFGFSTNEMQHKADQHAQLING